MSKPAVRMTFEQAITETDKLVNDSLENKSKGFSLMSQYLSKAKGKGVRTHLLLCSAMGEDNLISRDAIKIAAAIEILHMATLVHDDVIDDAPIRRTMDALHVKFGKKEAIICGDYLLCVAMTMVAELITDEHMKHIKYVTSITSALKGVCEGEYQQLLNNGNLDIGLRKYLRIISGKTAVLFYVAAHCGALLSDCDEKDVNRISKFGKYLGIVFQIADDCKDYEFSEEQAGKPVKNDIAEGIVTLPLIIAIRKNPELKNYAKQVISSIADPSLLVEEIISNGSIKDAKNIMLRFRKKAKSSIQNIKNEGKKNQLLGMMDSILGI